MQMEKAQYRAACGVDFINPVKFYDTYATRDLEGYSMGLSFYPRFTDAGKAKSQRDVLEQKDAVRVRSCWGGIVAFDEKYFQPEGYKFEGVSSTDFVPPGMFLFWMLQRVVSSTRMISKVFPQTSHEIRAFT